MKYAESWLYGTVRGIPAPSAHGSGLFGNYPHEVAVMVCSCPEYLNGTKRELKKASICKKCKGSRLPLAPIGGTMRIHSSPGQLQQIISRQSAGTLRLPSTSSSSKKARPSILDSKNDPYDLMRRSRLITPELKSVNKNNAKSRAKSISPTRGRSKNRKRSPSPSESISINRSRSATRSKHLQQANQTSHECWMDNIDLDPGGRRSILHYDINPYDLISKTKNSSSEFSPVQDDNFNYDLVLHSRKYENILNSSINSCNNKNTNGNNISITPSTTSISGQRIRTSRQSSLQSVTYRDTNNDSHINNDDTDDITYEHVSVDLIPKHHQIPQSDVLEKTNDSLILTTETLSKISTEILPPNNSIKSILKRPTSLVFSPTSDDPDTLSQCELTQISHTTTTISSAAPSSTPIPTSNNESSFTSYIDSISPSITNFDKNTIHSIRNQSKLNVNSLPRDHKHEKQTSKNRNSSNSASIAITPRSSSRNSTNASSGSQFYLPMPPRKKVQFLVENNIIHDEIILASSQPNSHHYQNYNHQQQQQEKQNEQQYNHHQSHQINSQHHHHPDHDVVIASGGSVSGGGVGVVVVENAIVHDDKLNNETTSSTLTSVLSSSTTQTTTTMRIKIRDANEDDNVESKCLNNEVNNIITTNLGRRNNVVTKTSSAIDEDGDADDDDDDDVGDNGDEGKSTFLILFIASFDYFFIIIFVSFFSVLFWSQFFYSEFPFIFVSQFVFFLLNLKKKSRMSKTMKHFF